jgi:4-hydroxy-tetrahydrodipicolinate synthase
MFTPFSFDGKDINEAELRSSVRYLLREGIRLLNPAGTTGEFWTLTPREHRRVIRVVMEEAQAACPEALVVPGVSCQNLDMTLELAMFARNCGAQVLQLTLPYYLPVTADDAVSYYRRVSQEIDAGIMLYEIPRATGVCLRGELLRRICEECPGVVAIKTAAPADAPREFERLVREFRGRLRTFAATGTYYSPFTYLTGVHGITDTLANAAPQFGLTLDRLARAREWDEMNRLYQEAFDVLEIELLYGRAGLKEISNFCGFNAGPTRFPLVNPLSLADREDIERRLREWPFTRKLLQRRTAPAGRGAAG